MIDTRNTYLVVCECGCPEHQLIFSWWPDETEPLEQVVYVEIHLAKQPLFRRIWTAIRYTFGYQCRYGAFDEVMINYKGVNSLHNFLGEFKEHAAKCKNEKQHSA